MKNKVEKKKAPGKAGRRSSSICRLVSATGMARIGMAVRRERNRLE
jgi:hypothetical protein